MQIMQLYIQTTPLATLYSCHMAMDNVLGLHVMPRYIVLQMQKHAWRSRVLQWPAQTCLSPTEMDLRDTCMQLIGLWAFIQVL